MANEVEESLNAYLARAGYSVRPEPGTKDAIHYRGLSEAYLAGFEDGLARGNEIALRSMDTALETMREHYPELSNNALRNYLSQDVARDVAFAEKSESERLKYPERRAAQDDPRGERDR